MSLIKWREKKYDPIAEFFNCDKPFFGAGLFPLLDKNLASFEKYWYPAVDVSEDQDNITVTVDLPGLKKDEVQINIDGDILAVKGERKVERREEKDKSYYCVERSYGTFQRNIRLNCAVDRDNVKAVYKNGVLEISLPKTEKSKPRKINIDEN